MLLGIGAEAGVSIRPIRDGWRTASAFTLLAFLG
jgi:hypothetical protein